MLLEMTKPKTYSRIILFFIKKTILSELFSCERDSSVEDLLLAYHSV